LFRYFLEFALYEVSPGLLTKVKSFES